MRHILALAIMAVSLHAETVVITAHGKTFHKTAACMSLARTEPGKLLKADRKAAEAHGLKACGICYRKPSAKKADNGAWAGASSSAAQKGGK